MTMVPFQLERSQRPVVVIDDDEDFREALAGLLEAEGIMVQSFASVAHANQRARTVQEAGCLLLDIDLPDVTGIEFQDQLSASGACTPIIFMTGYADVGTSVRAMKAGAVDFLCKPFADVSMLEAVASALSTGRHRRSLDRDDASVGERYATLTARQKEVMAFVVSGLMNKQIAYRVGLSEITVKVHRGHLMRKMQARSVAELVHMSHALGDGFADSVSPEPRSFSPTSAYAAHP